MHEEPPSRHRTLAYPPPRKRITPRRAAFNGPGTRAKPASGLEPHRRSVRPALRMGLRRCAGHRLDYSRNEGGLLRVTNSAIPGLCARVESMSSDTLPSSIIPPASPSDRRPQCSGRRGGGIAAPAPRMGQRRASSLMPAFSIPPVAILVSSLSALLSSSSVWSRRSFAPSRSSSSASVRAVP